MDFVFATPIRSVSSQENAVDLKQMKSLKSLKSSDMNMPHSDMKMPKQEPSIRKKLSQMAINTPSTRRKLGNVSNNTPIGGGGSSLKPHKGGLGAHHKEESFVKPLKFGATPEKKKGALATINQAIEDRSSKLPTVYEEENCYPLTKKQLREERDDPCSFMIWDDNSMSLAGHTDDEDSQKENRLQTVDELCELFWCINTYALRSTEYNGSPFPLINASCFVFTILSFI